MNTDAAIKALLDQVKGTSKNASAEQLAYLGRAIESVGSQSTLNEVVQKGSEQVKLVNVAGSRERADIARTGDKEIAEINKRGKEILGTSPGIISGAKPFLFGIAERYSPHGYGYTSQLGTMYCNKGEQIFKLMAGIEDNLSYRKWITPPSMQHFQNNIWHYNDEMTRYPYSHNYTYPNFMMSLMFVKNTTKKNITRNLYHLHSSRATSYGYASLNVGTPNATNGNKVTDISWKTVQYYTGNTATNHQTASIVIPAGKTVAIAKYNSSYYWTSWNGYRHIYRHGYRYMEQFLRNGLEIDVERTLNAQQASANHDYEIWR